MIIIASIAGANSKKSSASSGNNNGSSLAAHLPFSTTGSGLDSNTQAFVVTSTPWQFKWAYVCSAQVMNIAGGYDIDLDDASGSNTLVSGVVSTPGNTGSGTSREFYTKGTYTLGVTPGCNYAVTVFEDTTPNAAQAIATPAAAPLSAAEAAPFPTTTTTAAPKPPPTTTTVPPPTTTTSHPPTPTVPALTQQQQSAVASAKQYLQLEGFSQQGLIDQLDSPYGGQYSVTDATVAVDSLTVNWNAEALQSAKAYLALESFSCDALIQQLDSSAGSEFTVAQATYGATQAGDCGAGSSTGSTGSTGNTP